MASTSAQRLWGWGLRNVLLPFGDVVFRQHMMGRLRFLEHAQWWTREQIGSYREEKLRSMVRIAFDSVPLYRELFETAGIDPGRFRPQDLLRVPPVTKELLRENYPDRTTRATGYATRENRTSGSTGTNFVVRTDSKTTGWYRAALVLMLEWAGWRIGEPQVQTGMNAERSFDRILKDRLLRCSYVSAFDLTDRHLDEVLEHIQRRRIKHLWGYPGSLDLLARRALAVGWNEPLTSVVTWGDMLSPRLRNTITKAFSCAVHDTYGCAEGVEIAGQCGEDDGYHILELDTLVEFTDDDGYPVADGELGSVLLTRLYPGPMPLIRYRVGDVGRAGPDDLCRCGRELARMRSVSGRDADVIRSPSGNRLIVHYFTGVLEHFDEIDAFQVVQESIDRVLLRIVPRPGFTPATASRVVESLKGHGASDLEFDIDLVDDVPIEATGKRRFVISRLKEGQAT